METLFEPAVLTLSLVVGAAFAVAFFARKNDQEDVSTGELVAVVCVVFASAVGAYAVLATPAWPIAWGLAVLALMLLAFYGRAIIRFVFGR